MNRINLTDKAFLVVDDFGDMRTMIRGMLNLMGVKSIDNARHGAEAIERMEGRRYDVVLCDYNLGEGRNGQQVLEEARHRQLIGVGTAFLMITAENSREMVMSAVEHEPDAYLSKPFTKDLLFNRLERVMQKKEDLKVVAQALDQKNLAKAIDLLDAKIAQKPRNLTDLLRLKGDIAIRAGALDKAERTYQSVLANREIPWARLGLGRVYYAMEKYPQARAAFEQVIADNEGLIVARDWLSRVLQASGEKQLAQKVLAKAVEISPRSVIRQQGLGELAMENRDYLVAERAFGKAVSLGKDSIHKHPRIYSRLAESTIANDEHKRKDGALKVIEQMEREFRTDDSVKVYAALTRATVYQQAGDAKEAMEYMEVAEQAYKDSDSHDAKLMLSMAKANASLGNEERALALLKTAVSNNHDDAEFLRSVVSACEESGVSIAATDLIASTKKEIIDLNNRAVAMVEKGQTEEAISLFEQAAAGFSGNKTINANAAKVLLIHMKRFGVDDESLTKVRSYMERVRKVDPAYPPLAWAQAQLDRLLGAAN